MAAATEGKRYRPSDLPFYGLCEVFEAISKAEQKRRIVHLKHFRAKHLEENSDDYYAMYRLMLPEQDGRMYGLKEDALARALIEASSLPEGEATAKKLRNWRPSNHKNAGDLVGIAELEIFPQCCGLSDDEAYKSKLTVGDINRLLDRLSQVDANKYKTASGQSSYNIKTAKSMKGKILRELMQGLAPKNMKWILRHILGVGARHSLKLHLGLNPILDSFHPNAKDLYK